MFFSFLTLLGDPRIVEVHFPVNFEKHILGSTYADFLLSANYTSINATEVLCNDL